MRLIVGIVFCAVFSMATANAQTTQSNPKKPINPRQSKPKSKPAAPAAPASSAAPATTYELPTVPKSEEAQGSQNYKCRVVVMNSKKETFSISKEGLEAESIEGAQKACYSPDGTFEGYIGSCIDITERKMLEEELRKSIRQREEFLSIASHELKTPLTSLGLQIQILQHVCSGTEDLNQLRGHIGPMMEVADRQLRHMSDLIEKLLDISRIESGNFKMELRPSDLVQIATEVAERLSVIAHQADCSIQVAGEKSLIGNWDRSRILQVVSNLISNAIKYASGSKIEVNIRQEGTTAVLEVSDQGPGIEPTSLQRIFEKFHRALDTTHAGGLGLGLFVVRQIVQSHGGTVSAENLTPKGARFRVDLPLAGVEASI